MHIDEVQIGGKSPRKLGAELRILVSRPNVFFFLKKKYWSNWLFFFFF
jgi:hypothetical protein